MNKVVLVGRLVNDNKLNKSGLDLLYLRNTIAIKRDIKNKNGEYETDFIDFVCFRSDAEFLHNFTHKGDIIGVEGRLQNNTYERNGEKIKRLEVMAEKVRIVSSTPKQEKQEFEVSDDLLPF